MKTSNLFLGITTNNRLRLTRCFLECLSAIQLIFHSFMQVRSMEEEMTLFGMTSAQEGRCWFSSVQGKHLAVCWRLCSSGLTPGIPLQGLCQATSPSKPLLEAPPPLSLSALQFHNKHIMETKSLSIIYNSLQIAYSSSPDYTETCRHIVIHTREQQYTML